MGNWAVFHRTEEVALIAQYRSVANEEGTTIRIFHSDHKNIL